MKLFDRVTIITGGTSGIGLATAKRLSEEGALVVLAARDAKKGKVVQSQIENSLFIQTDVTDETSVQGLIDQVLAKFKHLDIVVNSAGMDDPLQEDITTFDQTCTTVLTIITRLHGQCCISFRTRAGN
jgi:NAD(P)-dependent dehydrogenase (short-subunit alcohol dehydrogenase family)